MLDNAQPTHWPAMIQDLVRHYVVLWHVSETSLPWLGPPYTSGTQRSYERHLDHFLAAVSAELTGAPQTESQQQAMWARKRPLDTVTNRTLHLCARILMQLDGLGAADLGPFKDLMTRSINLLLIDSAGRSARLYPRHYLRELETHSPFRFAALRQRRKQLARQQISLPRLIDLLAAPVVASARL